MALNIGNTGNFLPYLSYNAKAGRWYKKEDGTEVEIQNPTFLADFGNIKTGWFLFLEGQAPNIVFDPDISTPAVKPSDKHKRGFKLELYSQQQLGGLVEFTSASMHTCAAINEIYAQYEKDAAANAGKYPVVSCKSTIPMKDKMGTNYKPVFTIEKWVASDAFKKDQPTNVVAIQPAASSSPAAPVSPPPAKTAVASEF